MTIQTKTIGRLPVYLGDYDNTRSYGKKNRVTLYGSEFESKHDNNNTAPATWDGAETITFNTTDWQVISNGTDAWIAGNDKPASSEEFPYNGMGRVVLKKNMVNGVNVLTEDAFYTDGSISGQPLENTIFVIKYDFVLVENIEIPANCVLEFDGGSINGNGANKNTITGNNTQIVADEVEIFNAVIFDGSWNIPYITSNWITDIHSANVVRQLINLTNEDVENTVVLHPGNYPLAFSHNFEYGLILNSNTRLIINGDIVLQANGYKNYAIIWAQSQFDSTLFPDGVWNGTVLTSEDEIYDWVEAGIITKITRNITIEGSGHIIGDRPNHTSDEGEWGHGIELYYTHDVEIKGVNISDTWGDGIYVTGVVDCNIHDVEINDCGRNDITLTSCNNLMVSNCVLSKSIYKEPKAGISIEPNYKYELCNNVEISNNKFYNCSKAVEAVAAHAKFFNLSITNNEIIWGDSSSPSPRAFKVYGNNFSTYWPENVTIKNNRILNYERLLWCTYTKNITIDNNIFDNMVDSGSTLGADNTTTIEHSERIIFSNNRLEHSILKFNTCDEIECVNNLVDGYTGLSYSNPTVLYFDHCYNFSTRNNKIVGGVLLNYTYHSNLSENVIDITGDSTLNGGVVIEYGNNGKFVNNKIIKNVFNQYIVGLYIGNFDHCIIKNNKFEVPNNVTSSAVLIKNSSNNSIILNNSASVQTLTKPFVDYGTDNYIDENVCKKTIDEGIENTGSSVPAQSSYAITSFNIPVDKIAFVQLSFPDAHAGASNFFCTNNSCTKLAYTHSINVCDASVVDGAMTITTLSYGIGSKIGYKVTYIG